MKFNTTYKAMIDFKTTMQAMADIKKSLTTYMTCNYQLINVIPPMVAEENDEINIDFDLQTRNISFENSAHKIVKLFLSYSNWTREFLRRIKPQIHEGIYFEANTVWRDLHESSVATITNHELTFALRIANDHLVEKLEAMTDVLYALIYKMAQEISKKYKIQNIFPQYPNFISSQQLENELPDFSFYERANEFIINEQAFFLKKVGTILFSGKQHSYIPIQFYDLRNFNQIIMFDRNNAASLIVASIGILASGRQLADQLTLYGHGEMTSLPLYKTTIEDHRKFIEIKINMPALAMALLAKGHISEVQAGVTSDEAKNIKNRYGIDIY